MTVNTTQQNYLAGFLAGVGARARRESAAPAEPPAVTLSPGDNVQRTVPPLDAFDRLLACARDDCPPDAADAAQFESLGCFYEAPRRDSFRLRLRLPGRRISRVHLTALAAITQEWGGGWVEINDQGGLDLPAVPVRAVAEAFRQLEALGLTTRGTGEEGGRAVGGSVLAGARLLSSELVALAEWLESRGENEMSLSDALANRTMARSEQGQPSPDAPT